ncbi:MAG: K(+)-transporting ATPase subunit C [Myxococcales bacterium]
MNPILKETLSSVRALAVLLVLCCVLYPVTVYAIGQTVFPWQANGSLVDKDGNHTTVPENAAGSRLLGQSSSSPGYFHPRPSAAGSGYDAASSSGTNLGPISDKFLNGVADDPKTKDVDESFAGIKQLVQAYREENGLPPDALVPGDAVTRSASGLDPHISPRNAELQVARVAKARGLDETRVRDLVRTATEGRGWGLFGEPGVNVLMLNISLDKISKSAPSQNHVAQGI